MQAGKHLNMHMSQTCSLAQTNLLQATYALRPSFLDSDTACLLFQIDREPADVRFGAQSPLVSLVQLAHVAWLQDHLLVANFSMLSDQLQLLRATQDGPHAEGDEGLLAQVLPSQLHGPRKVQLHHAVAGHVAQVQ